CGPGPASSTRSLVRDAALRGRADVLDVLVEGAARRLEGRRDEGRAPRGELLLGDEKIHHALFGVDADDVAVADEGDGAAHLRLGRDVADDEAVGAAREAAVRDERDVVAEAGAHDDGGRRQQLRHAGAALRTLVADDDDLALQDLALLDGVEHVLLAVEGAGGALEGEAFLARDLRDRALGGEGA